MNIGHILAAIFVIVIFFIIMGNMFSETCVTVRDCHYCWKPMPVTVTSDLCPTDQPCSASPEAQQHNAYVDAALCACGLAKKQQFADNQLNEDIKGLVYAFSGYKIDDVESFCNQPATIATKVLYG